MVYVLALADERATLPRCGGKGASLARLASAGLPVPAGFHVTTSAYSSFVADNGLAEVITTALATVDPTQPATLEAASAKIRERFAQGTIPPVVAKAIAKAYATLPGTDPAVAMRSSATARGRASGPSTSRSPSWCRHWSRRRPLACCSRHIRSPAGATTS